MCCLTLAGPSGQGLDIGGIAEQIAARMYDEGPVRRLLSGLAVLPPNSVDEVVEQLSVALRDTLREHWVTVRTRALASSQGHELTRLWDLLERLLGAVPPPTGRGAVGVDLEGRVTVLESKKGVLTWGPQGGALEVVASGGRIERAEVARRLVRARAHSPANPALQRQVDGDVDFVEAACRWTAAALRRRTVQLLLRRQTGAIRGR